MENITGYRNGTVEWDGNWRYLGVILSPNMIILFSALNIFLSVTAFLGNTLILIALHKASSIYPPTKLFFRCLAVTDLCVGLIAQPFFVTMLIKIVVRFEIAATQNFSTVLLCGVSILTSTAISVDRLLALLLGLRYRHVVTLRRVRAVIVCFWLMGALCGSIWFVSSEVYRKVVLVSIPVCLVISTASYGEIFFTLRHNEVQLQGHVHQAQPNGGGIPLNIARYKKTVSTIAWVQLALLACYAPEGIVGVLTVYWEKGSAEWFMLLMRKVVAQSLIYLNSSLNPILYCWKIRDVRQEVKNTIRQVCCLSS